MSDEREGTENDKKGGREFILMVEEVSPLVLTVYRKLRPRRGGKSAVFTIKAPIRK